MISERQIISILAMAGAGIALSFAIYNVYLAFNSPASAKI